MRVFFVWLQDVFGWWVNLMCSGLGLIFTISAVISGDRWAGWQRGVFVALGIIGLVLASFLSWRKRYREAEQERAKNSKPDIYCGVMHAGYKQLLSSMNSPPPRLESDYPPDILVGLKINVAARTQIPFFIDQIRINAAYLNRELKCNVVAGARIAIQQQVVVVRGAGAISRPVDEILPQFEGLHRTINPGQREQGWVFFVLQAGQDATGILLEDIAFSVTVVDQFGTDHSCPVPRDVIANATKFK